MTISQRNRNIADTLTQRLLNAMADEVHAVILFGSVARGEATESSDIDLYIISKDSSDTRRRMEAICDEVQAEFANIAPIHHLFTDKIMFWTEAVACRCARTMNIINQGILLHDDGAYADILEDAKWDEYMSKVIPLPNSRTEAVFHIDELIDGIQSAGRNYIIQGMQAVSYANHTQPNSLDMWLRKRFAKDKDAPQATAEVIAHLVNTGRFRQAKFICPDSGSLADGLDIVS